MASERQLKASLDDVRADHLARYRWAAARVPAGALIDAACGCGYGSAILADAGHTVAAFDVSPVAIHFAEQHWHRRNIAWRLANVSTTAFPAADVVVSFETLEHLDDPKAFLFAARAAAPRLLISVPNEKVIPFSKAAFPFHHRHYTRKSLARRLEMCGWRATAWFGQADKFAPVEPDLQGRTLIADAERIP